MNKVASHLIKLTTLIAFNFMLINFGTNCPSTLDICTVIFQSVTVLHNFSLHFGPSGVRALPLAAGINIGGHYKWHFFLFSLLSFFSPAHC